MGTADASGANRAVDAATRAINSPLLEDNSIQGAQGILINICGSSSLTLNEVHEASSVIEKAAHENANIIFGAVMDENMKEQVKITVIAAGFREAARRQPHQKPSYLPKTWKAGREEEAPVAAQPQEIPQEAPRPVVSETIHQENTTAADDLDVPTFLRRAAQKA
jgi:cell division protein FtsZ